MDFMGPDTFRMPGWETLVVAAALIMLAGVAVAGSGQAVFGVWQHPENGSRIEVYPCQSGRLCVKILVIGDGQQLDDKNTNPDLRSRPIVGLTIVAGAERKADGSWSGRMYNRTDGQFYDSTLASVGSDKLKVTGCATPALCRSVMWLRVPKPKPS